MTKTNKTLHWLKIHRIALRRMWGNLSDESREIVASDTLGLSETLKWFNTQIENETNRLYEDPDFSYNSPYTFQHER